METTCTKCYESYPATPEYFTRRVKGLPELRGACKKCLNKAEKEYQRHRLGVDKRFRKGEEFARLNKLLHEKLKK